MILTRLLHRYGYCRRHRRLWRYACSDCQRTRYQ